MKREFVFPLVVGLILGGLLMMFWQFNVRLNTARTAVAQLQQTSSQNSTTLSEIVSFINQATGANKAAANTQTPATTPAE